MDSEEGMVLLRWVESFGEMKALVDLLVFKGILRCLSPERSERCDESATHIFWTDQAEWYPCCDRHRIRGQCWTGSTFFTPHVLKLTVIPEKANEWLASQPEEKRDQWAFDTYDRESGA